MLTPPPPPPMAVQVSEAGTVGVWTNPVPERLPGPAVPPEVLEQLQRQQEREGERVGGWAGLCAQAQGGWVDAGRGGGVAAQQMQQ